MNKLAMLSVITTTNLGVGMAANARAEIGATHETKKSADLSEPRLESTETVDGIQRPTPECLAKMLCELKEKVRWRTPAWTTERCDQIAQGILKSSVKHALTPGVILGIILNESDMNENAVREYFHGDKLYAADGGIAGLRCIFDQRQLHPIKGKPKKVCTNAWVKGMTWTQIMDPVTNIEIASTALEFWKNGGAQVRKIVKERDRKGHIRPKLVAVPCLHKDHGFWAHFNHGPNYIVKGPARHYPHRVAVLHFAFAQALGMGIPAELYGPITIHDKGQKPRRIDKPVGFRQRDLYAKILSCSGLCSGPIAIRRQSGETALAPTVASNR